MTARSPSLAEGPFFEDFSQGQTLQHGGRTITQADNIWFTLLTCNTNPIHFDEGYAAQTEFGRTLINSTLTLAIATGISVKDISQSGVNLGWDNIRLPNPLFPGDTLRCESKVLSCRASASRQNMGIITVETLGRNQVGAEVIRFERSVLVFKRPSEDGHAGPHPDERVGRKQSP